jgi:transcription elongation factor GreA
LESNDSYSLLDAVGLYASSTRVKADQNITHKQLLRFAQWCGPDRDISSLAPSEIGEYGEQWVGNGAGAQAIERLQEVKKFLSFAKKKGLTERNLAQHLRIRKSRARARSSKKSDGESKIELTPDGHSQLVAELEKLKAERAPIASEIRRAAADKDVRENVPLEAAREQLGHVESRIRQIEATLSNAVVVDARKRGRGQPINLGAQVRLKDLDSGRETSYTLVSVSEAKPLEGRISDVSPVGQAMLKRTAGQEIEVDTPRGSLKYRILRVS